MTTTKSTQLKATSSFNNADWTLGDSTCVITSDTFFKGTFTCDTDLRVDGRIIGEVNASKRVVVGDGGVIEGDVKASHMVVQGDVKGNIQLQGDLFLSASARVEGDVLASQIRMEEGAVIEGVLKIGE
jgi:cytoskeletal protein CcmA (bactofilin family)